MRKFLKAVMLIASLSCTAVTYAWQGMPMPELHVEGRYLVDTHGNVVNLHGFAQTYSPWFNEMGSKWTNYNVAACLSYNQGLIDKILDAGWDVNFLRLHMDPYWSNTPGVSVNGEADISAFDFYRFKKYLNEVFIPMAEYAVDHGLYVVMRPPGVCPEKIAVGDDYQKYLIKVWTWVASHEKLRNHPNIMFELANEPVQILGTDGVYGGNGQACFDALKEYFQPVVDAMRDEGCHNVLWVPGLGYQANYSGFAENPIEGENIGYAVHIYPGWFGSNSADGYRSFRAGWDKDIKPVADFAPIMITEMDWAPEKYNSSWGKGVTGDESYGFGANFMRLCDESGNASWLLFTGPDLMAQFRDEPGTPGSYTFLNDPEACPWAIYHKYQEYREAHEYPYPDYKHVFTSDFGDGTFLNPVIYGDFPDIDVIRVGDTYYMMSTTMFLFPGATILRSYDLVNWEYCANPIEYIELDDAYSLQGGQHRYSRGMWASSMQYNERDGKFYILYNTLNDGAYLMTATDPEGIWSKRKLKNSFYDCGILFDGDNTYVVHGNTEIWIDRVDEDFNVVESHKIFTGPSDNAIEGSRLYHIGDYYYVYSTYCGWPGKQTCLRSHEIFGQYEEKLLLDYQAVHQGALVQTEQGDWWTMLHRDLWPWGRVPYLLPVTIVDGWPLIAKDMDDLEDVDKPDIVCQHYTPRLESNDVFRSITLGKQWQWNHVADASRWSLVERAGYLRLYTASVTDDFYQARNTLTQRMLCPLNDMTRSYGTVSMDISNMKEGDRAGIATLQDPMAGIGVKVVNGKRKLYYTAASLTSKISTKEVDCGEVDTDVVYLRAVASFLSPGKVQFYYSTDNTTYTKIGDTWTMQYDLSVFVGNRFAIFNYATKGLGGWVDIDWFSTEPAFDEDTFYANNFTGYTRESLTASSLSAGADELVLMTGSSQSLDVYAEFEDGHRENVAASAKYTIEDPTVLTIRGGNIKALKDGWTRLRIDYQDPLGGVLTINVGVECTTFPLVEGLFNPSIWESGTFDESTHTVTTGTYGFAGWHYTNGVNLADYKYIVAKVEKQPQAAGMSFRVFDENNYWAGCAAMDKKSSTDCDYFVGKLQSLPKEDGSRNIDPSHIYYVGFWTIGHAPFVIRTVYVTNDDHYLNEPDSLTDILYDASTAVDVYTTGGILLYQQISRAEALQRLPTGIYIIGDKKVMIRK